MNETKQIVRLSSSEIADIQRQACAKLGECRKTQDVIGTQIFSILSLYARVIYYPLGKEGPWGITYMWGMDSGVPTDKPFVAINTSIPVDAQVFAAAHELYHIWYDEKAEAIPASILGDTDEHGAQLDVSELKANRFAAEFLVDEEMLRQEMRIYSIAPHKIRVKDILQLAALFTVPYKMIVKRLHEIEAINHDEREQYLSKTETSIEQLRKRYSFSVPETDNRIAIDNLVELAVAVYEKERISHEKLQYLLSISNLEPSDVGISEPQGYIPPSDDKNKGETCSLAYAKVKGIPIFATDERDLQPIIDSQLNTGMNDIHCLRIVDIINMAKNGEIGLPRKSAKAIWRISGKNKDDFDRSVWPIADYDVEK